MQERFIKGAGLEPPIADDEPAEEGDAEWRAFLVWDQQQLAASPPDVKDAPGFRFRAYSHCPPFTPQHQSLAARLLTEELWARHRHQATATGFTLSNLIQGAARARAPGAVGLAAGDADSYRVFADLFLACLRAHHGAELPEVPPPLRLDSDDIPALHLRRNPEEARAWARRVLSVRLA